MLDTFLDTNNFSITLPDLLSYLQERQKEKAAKHSPAISFTPLEAVSLMHCLVLSKEQMRQIRYFLAQKNIEFPTTNELLPVRKSLRHQTCPVLEKKGRGLNYKELVGKTVASIIKIVKEVNPKQSLQHLR